MLIFTSPPYRLGLQPTTTDSWALGLRLDSNYLNTRKSEANQGSFYRQGSDVCQGQQWCGQPHRHTAEMAGVGAHSPALQPLCEKPARVESLKSKYKGYGWVLPAP